MTIFTNPADAAPEAAGAYVEAVLGKLGERDPLEVLAGTPDELERLVRHAPPAVLRRPEAPGRWSVGEVLAHLADSELVWAYRLRMVLGQDRPSLTGYDQDAWAARLSYADVDPSISLERFEFARRWNLALLDRQSAGALDRVGVHAERGKESVRHMIRLYAGHDLVHVAQIQRILSTHQARGEA